MSIDINDMGIEVAGLLDRYGEAIAGVEVQPVDMIPNVLIRCLSEWFCEHHPASEHHILRERILQAVEGAEQRVTTS